MGVLANRMQSLVGDYDSDSEGDDNQAGCANVPGEMLTPVVRVLDCMSFADIHDCYRQQRSQ